MKSSNISISNVVQGFPQFLQGMEAEIPERSSDLVCGLFVLLRQAGLYLTYADADVLSGHATQLLYAREHPECIELAFLPPVESLFKACDVEWSEFVPSGMDAAFDIIVRSTQEGKPLVGRLKRVVLFYGHGGSEWERALEYCHLSGDLQSRVEAILECEQNLWRYPLDEGNTFVAVRSAPKQIEHLKELCHRVAHRAVKAWKSSELAGCASGDAAYRTLELDLRQDEYLRHDTLLEGWLEGELEVQWRSRKSLADFFERHAPRFGGAERKSFAKAGFYYQQCHDEWYAFHMASDKDLRRRNPETQVGVILAKCVARAREWEQKAVNELLRVVA